MAQPTPYARQADFSAFAAAQPTSPLQGTSVDAEFNAIKATTDQTLANLALIQRDDGKLLNNSVGVDQIKPEVTMALNAAADWLTATDYVVNDAVYQSSIVYRCLVAHTSGTFSTDLAASKWQEIVDLSGPDTARAAAEAAQAAAELAQTGAETAETNAGTSETNAAASAVEADASAIAAAASAVDAAAATGGVRVSANDTTPGEMNGKLVAGAGITLTEGNDGGDETLTVASSTTANHGANIQTALGLI